MSRLDHIHSAADKFMAKANRTNVGFTAYKKTPEYATLRQMIRDAIMDQADEVAEAIREQGIATSIVVNKAFTPMGQLIEEDTVTKILIHAFEHSVDDLYRRIRLQKAKTNPDFKLQNPGYIKSLQNQSNYLLNKSSLDDTTRQQLIDTVQQVAEDGGSYADIAIAIQDGFGDIADWRAEMIARTELASAAGDAQLAGMQESGVLTKSWVVAGSGCPICEDNEGDGEIPVDEDFSSGDSTVPAHPNCECYIEAGAIDLNSIDLWGGN